MGYRQRQSPRHGIHPQDETTTDGNPASDSSDAATTPPPFIGGEPKNGDIAFKANQQARRLFRASSMYTQSVFLFRSLKWMMFSDLDRGDFQSTSPANLTAQQSTRCLASGNRLGIALAAGSIVASVGRSTRSSGIANQR